MITKLTKVPMKISLVAMIACMFLITLSAQNLPTEPDWVQKMYAENANAGEVLKLYDAYYADHVFVKNQHTQYLKRWMRNIARDQTGEYNSILTESEREKLRAQYRTYALTSKDASRRSSSGAWTCIGPSDWDHDAASRSYAPGAAHVFTVEQAPSNPDILYAGSANAGVWKSVDHGITWTPKTIDMPVNEVYSLDIHPTNPDIIYASMAKNIQKSVDGGTTWAVTGNAVFQALSMDVYDILFHPTMPNIVFAGSAMGLWRTNDSGATWTSVISNNTQEIEKHPTNDSIYYAIEHVGDVTKFYRSIDIGVTFQLQTGGWPTPSAPDENKRTEIAVTPAAPDLVVAFVTGRANGGDGLYGIYKSTDKGTTWTFACCGPQPGGLADLTTTPPNININGWDDTGADNGGQAYYDLSLAISPTNADSIFAGGVNMWVSADGGSTFTCPSKWSHPHKTDYVHADIHDIHYYPNGEIWTACDGGIFYSTDGGVNFTRRSVGIQGSDFWGFGVNFWGGDVMLGGTYHNGTLIKNGNVYNNDWLSTDGGDNDGGFTNPGREKRVYGQNDIKDLVQDRTVAIPTRPYPNQPHVAYQPGFTSQITAHPNNYSKQYFGKDNCLYLTNNDHLASDIVHCFGESVADVEVSWADPNYIYVCTNGAFFDDKKLWKTTDGGANWTDITPSTSYYTTNRWLPYDISLHESNPNIVYIGRVTSATTTYDGDKVFKSIDGGATWINLTTSVLDGEQLTNIVYQRGTIDGLYVGTRRTVYYKSGNLANWMICNNGLPMTTFSTKLVINYRQQKIIQGTNRSVWEMPLVEASAPQAEISVNKTVSLCARDTFYFSDYSALSESGVSWSWSFPGANYVSSTTVRQPKVVYGNSGLHDVSLTVTDANGSDNVTMTDYIDVSAFCDADTFPGKSMALTNQGDCATVPVSAHNVNLTVTAWVKPDGIQPEYSAIFMGNEMQAGFNYKTDNKLGYHWPGGQWWFTSNLAVPTGEWSYVAMVASPTGMTLYLNGVAEHQSIALDTATFTSATIGRFQTNNGRNTKGDIDEVSVWNRSLTEAEIRELMHLTKKDKISGPMADPSLLAYYQFNEPSGTVVYDRVGVLHGELTGGASLIPSAVPVGAGSASTMAISSVGSYLFPDENVRLGFGSSAGLPNGDVVVSEINWPPNNPTVDAITGNNKYYAIHSFGTNAQIILDSFSIYDADAGSRICANHSLYRRAFNDVGDSWGSARRTAENCTNNWIYFPLDTHAKQHQYTLGYLNLEGNLYVDASAVNGTGYSWLSPFTQLQSAINASTLGDTIFVAQGTYRPRAYASACMSCSAFEEYTVQPKSGTTLIGGFPSGGSSMAGRDWESYATNISGYFVESSIGYNAYHVLTLDTASMDILMDGFYIQGGLADQAATENAKGSGLYCLGKVSLSNMEFSNNNATQSIIHCYGVHANLTLKKSQVINNTTSDLILDVDGGAIFILDEDSNIKQP